MWLLAYWHLDNLALIAFNCHFARKVEEIHGHHLLWPTQISSTYSSTMLWIWSILLYSSICPVGGNLLWSRFFKRQGIGCQTEKFFKAFMKSSRVRALWFDSANFWGSAWVRSSNRRLRGKNTVKIHEPSKKSITEIRPQSWFKDLERLVKCRNWGLSRATEDSWSRRGRNEFRVGSNVWLLKVALIWLQQGLVAPKHEGSN